MTARPAAVVLAGGAGRRLGGIDKPLMELHGQPLLARILEALAGQAAPIAISANGDASRFTSFGLPVLQDGAFLGQGPLGGVLAGLDWAAAQGVDTLLTVPGDTPFIPRDLAVRLAPAPSCAVRAGRTHHLVALWPVDARTELRQFLTNPGSRRVADFAASIGMRQTVFPIVASDPFFNINTPSDLAEAQARAGRAGAGDEP
jgi:molybdopterin-guanine dinucleotide biosynthesis protein A